MSLPAGNSDDLRRRLDAALSDFNAGRLGEAAKNYRAIINEKPNQPDALHMLGAIAYRMGKFELAIQLYDEAVKAKPNFALAWSNRALILRILDRQDEALQSARKSIAYDPKLADGWDIAGLLLREKKQFAEAREHHARAVALNPENPHMQNNYAVALLAEARLRDAYRVATKAVSLDSSPAIAHLTLGNILNEAGWPERAITEYRKAAELDPNLSEAVASEGRSLMLIGDMENGWAKMERRSYDQKRYEKLPRWRGEKIRNLLLYAEQGVGDIIQCLRYLPKIRGHVEAITLEVPVSLKRLIAAHVQDKIITPEDPLPAADAHGLLMSLPYICKTTLTTVPAAVPYLHPKEEWRRPWRERLSHLPRPRIGIVWMGNPLYARDRERSIPFEKIKSLLHAAKPHFVSLQKGVVIATHLDTDIFDAENGLTDFADTAGLIAELDLVITVDTGVAHLAGALGKPVWVFLPFTPDWRWMLGREDSPWYPTMRLFRQGKPREWEPVIARVTTELRKFISGDSSVLSPSAWDGKILRQNPDATALS